MSKKYYSYSYIVWDDGAKTYSVTEWDYSDISNPRIVELLGTAGIVLIKAERGGGYFYVDIDVLGEHTLYGEYEIIYERVKKHDVKQKLKKFVKS